MRALLHVAAAIVVTLAAGCSSSDPAPSGSGTTSSSGSSAGAVTAPALSTVEKMDGALHVTWTNADSAYDTIEGERQATMPDGSIMEQYKVVFSVPGGTDNKMDATATDNMKYTYRLRGKKGSTYSDYSNVMSANPKQ
jgi:hypothetical protein